ncbi:MAG TPA: LamG domain-containing protein [Verrucomicrobiae bacterium]
MKSKPLIRMKITAVIFGLAFCSAVHAQTFLTNGLVAYYQFSGNANDASGNGHNGTVYGATLSPDRFGQSNQAYHFNGSSRIFIANSDLVSGSALTLSAWIKPDSLSSNWMNVISGGTQNSYLLGLATNSAQGNLNFRPPSVFVSSAPGTMTTNTWTHLAMVYDGTNLTLFINGSKVASQPANGPLYQDSEEILNIGAYQYYYAGTVYNDAFSGFVGAIDDVRIYNRNFSDSEVQQLYQVESPPSVNIVKAVTVSFSNLTVSTNYQLQVSTDLNSWTNFGTPFTATNSTMIYSNYWNVSDWNQLFFRLH